MPSKLQFYSQLADHAAGQITGSYQEWTAFLTTAARLYKYPYRKAGYSQKFRAEHEADILLHQAAKKAFDELGVKKLPTVKSLQTEYAALLEQKKKAYGEYRRARDEMRELLTHKANVDRLLGEEQEAEKEVERRQGHGR